MIEAELLLDSGSWFPCKMLPDSGATATTLPRKYAVSLGFDIRDCEERRFDTGNGVAIHHEAPRPVSAIVAGRTIELHPCFAKIGVPVLGREDFFAEFYVEVDEINRFVKITPHDQR